MIEIENRMSSELYKSKLGVIGQGTIRLNMEAINKKIAEYSDNEYKELEAEHLRDIRSTASSTGEMKIAWTIKNGVIVSEPVCLVQEKELGIDDTEFIITPAGRTRVTLSTGHLQDIVAYELCRGELPGGIKYIEEKLQGVSTLSTTDWREVIGRLPEINGFAAKTKTMRIVEPAYCRDGKIMDYTYAEVGKAKTYYVATRQSSLKVGSELLFRIMNITAVAREMELCRARLICLSGDEIVLEIDTSKKDRLFAIIDQELARGIAIRALGRWIQTPVERI